MPAAIPSSLMLGITSGLCALGFAEGLWTCPTFDQSLQDIWSMGVVLYELYTLRSPFAGPGLNYYMLGLKTPGPLQRCMWFVDMGVYHHSVSLFVRNFGSEFAEHLKQESRYPRVAKSRAKMLQRSFHVLPERPMLVSCTPSDSGFIGHQKEHMDKHIQPETTCLEARAAKLLIDPALTLRQATAC